MKKIALFIVSFFLISTAFAQVAPKKPVPSEYSWRILQEAQFYYDNNNYSNAINLALKAKENRKEESRWESYTLDMSLSPLAVRRAGTEFSEVLPVLVEREQSESINLINKYLKLYGPEKFGNSVYKLKAWIDEKSVYPEADYLIGKIYQVEGEYKSAFDFYEKARSAANFLDVPDQVYDILYSMADLSYQNRNYEQYEQVLLLILSKDPNFSDSVLKNAMLKVIDTNNKKNVDRFFTLFRCKTTFTLKALYKLSEIYEKREEYNNSLFCSALGAIEGFTQIFESISERDAGFSFTTINNFIEKIGEYEDIMNWCEENKFWDSLISFAEKCAYRGDIIFANSFLKALSVSIPDSYYRSAAFSKIVK